MVTIQQGARVQVRGDTTRLKELALYRHVEVQSPFAGRTGTVEMIDSDGLVWVSIGEASEPFDAAELAGEEA